MNHLKIIQDIACLTFRFCRFLSAACANRGVVGLESACSWACAHSHAHSASAMRFITARLGKQSGLTCHDRDENNFGSWKGYPGPFNPEEGVNHVSV